jgi:hypothetical protein
MRSPELDFLNAAGDLLWDPKISSAFTTPVSVIASAQGLLGFLESRGTLENPEFLNGGGPISRAARGFFAGVVRKRLKLKLGSNKGR